MLTLSAITVIRDARPIVADVTFSVSAGSRTALVGPNGSGKTTLLRVAAGLLAPDRGHVARPPDDAIRYVPQDPLADVGGSTRSWLVGRAGLAGARHRLDAAEAAMAEGAPGGAEAYADALDAYGAAGGWVLESRLERALDELNLPAGALDRPTATLSGGQRTRLCLAAVVAAPDGLLLLDEPTNHLDADGIAVLQDVLAAPGTTALIVSHDRALLDAVATDVVELDPFSRTATARSTTWAEHQRLRTAQRQAQAAAAARLAAEADRLRRAVQRQSVSAARTGDSRPPSDNDKFRGHFITQRSAARAGSTAKALERRLERLDHVEEPRERWDLRLDLNGAPGGPDEVVTATGLEVVAGGFRLGPLDVAVRRGERVVVDGVNGSGKTLLVRTLAGRRRPDGGFVRRGPDVRVAVLDQDGDGLADARTVAHAFAAATGLVGDAARSALAKLELGADDVDKPTRALSPGERCRLALGIAAAVGPHLLVVDEPTNHLDLDGVAALGAALATFQGTLVVVTHDRALRAEVAPTRRIVLRNGRIAADEPIGPAPR